MLDFVQPARPGRRDASGGREAGFDEASWERGGTRQHSYVGSLHRPHGRRESFLGSFSSLHQPDDMLQSIKVTNRPLWP